LITCSLNRTGSPGTVVGKLQNETSAWLYDPQTNLLITGNKNILLCGTQGEENSKTMEFDSKILAIDKGYWVVTKKAVLALSNDFTIEDRYEPKSREKILDFTILSRKSVIIQTEKHLYLVGRKQGIKWNMTIGSDSEVHLIPQAGFVVDDSHLLTFYHLLAEPEMYNVSAPPIVQKVVFGLFKKSLPEATETDKAFRYSKISRSLSETTEVMQQNLLKEKYLIVILNG